MIHKHTFVIILEEQSKVATKHSLQSIINHGVSSSPYWPKPDTLRAAIPYNEALNSLIYFQNSTPETNNNTFPPINSSTPTPITCHTPVLFVLHYYLHLLYGFILVRGLIRVVCIRRSLYKIARVTFVVAAAAVVIVQKHIIVLRESDTT